MALTSGSRVGLYEVVEMLGAGGMGEVYRARDTRLKRDVAIKVMPAAFSHDADRVARFQREAELLATLNHPNIAAVYGMEQSEGASAIVLELVEGDTLAERLARTSSGKNVGSGLSRTGAGLPLEEALAIARQIADALEAAHEKGIVHRDLKPANIKVTPEGKVKVLDFGLAKMLETEASPSALSMSPTLSVHATYAGVILGTAAYMSPEQARGRPVDRRSDNWAFGCVLFEMLAGQRTFDAGDTVSDAVAAILKNDPDWSALPADTPAHIRTLLRRCLQKDPQKRLPHIGMARFEIDEGPADAGASALRQAAALPLVVPARPLWKRGIPLAAAAVVAATVTSIAWWSVRPSTSRPVVTRFSFALPDGQQFTSTIYPVLAISPDGTKMVHVANNRLYLKSMSEIEARPIPGTDAPTGVSTPAFSPDGQSIAFVSNGMLKRIATTGGAAVTICPVGDQYGMSWGEDGIVIGQGIRGVIRVSPNGGTPERLVAGKEGELAHGPQVLPGGKYLLFTLATGPSADSWDKARIVVQSIGSSDQKTILAGGSDARYLPTGHLVYALGGSLMAVPFDLRRLEITGSPAAVVEGIRRSTGGTTGTSQIGLSNTGSLVYLPGPTSLAAAQQDIGLTDRKGVVQPLKLPPTGLYEYPRASPDGKRIAFGTDDGKEAIVWIYELGGTSSTRRLTFGGKNKFPIWSADGRRITFQSDREGDLGIWWQAADGTGTAERLTKAEQGTSHIPESWSSRAGPLLYTVTERTLQSSLWMLSLQDRKAAPFGGVRTKGSQIASAFSPDGKWVAYTTNETGSVGDNNLYVQPFPATGAKYQISKAGENGHHPMWSADGKELFYVPQVGQFVAVTVTTQPSFSFGNPVAVPRAFGVAAPVTPRTFDTTPDGRILSVIGAGQTQPGSAVQQIHVVLNWFEELKTRVPAR